MAQFGFFDMKNQKKCRKAGEQPKKWEIKVKKPGDLISL